MPVVMLVVGTRPEAIKMAPVALAIHSSAILSLHLCASGQHDEMLDQALSLFNLVPDSNLAVMTPSQTLNGLMQALLGRLDSVMAEVMPDLVVVHGDTATCFAASLAAFQRKVPVAHVEAGLRTGNIDSPWPEEAYRSMVARIARRHYAPTPSARDNLLREQVAPGSILVTGNTVIDALMWMKDSLDAHGYRPWPDSPLARLRTGARRVLITGHRRENHGEGIRTICQAIAELAGRYPDTDFVYPVHLNPAIKDVAERELANLPNVHLTPPQDYRDFVWLMGGATLILTDSGGLQEEAPALGVPVLVMREHTERIDALDAGTVMLTGSASDAIVAVASRLLDTPEERQRIAQIPNPYGQGDAADKIVRDMESWLLSRRADVEARHG